MLSITTVLHWWRYNNMNRDGCNFSKLFSHRSVQFLCANYNSYVWWLKSLSTSIAAQQALLPKAAPCLHRPAQTPCKSNRERARAEEMSEVCRRWGWREVQGRKHKWGRERLWLPASVQPVITMLCSLSPTLSISLSLFHSHSHLPVLHDCVLKVNGRLGATG